MTAARVMAPGEGVGEGKLAVINHLQITEQIMRT